MRLNRHRRKPLNPDSDRPNGTEAADRLFAWADDLTSNPIAPDDTDLTALAEAYSCVQVALTPEQFTMDRTRKNELWEEIVNTHQSTASVSRAMNGPGNNSSNSVSAYSPGRSRETSHAHATNHHQGNWQTALNVALIVVLLLGITGIVWNRDFFNLGGGGSGSATRPQLAMMNEQATPGRNEKILPTNDSCKLILSTEIATPSIQTDRWRIIQQSPAHITPNRTYTPEGPVDSSHVTQLNATFSMVKQCINGQDLIPFSVATSRYIWEHNNPYLSSVQMEQLQHQQQNASKEIVKLWKYQTTLDASLITVGPFYPLESDELHSLNDGRIGAIVYKRTFPSISNTPAAESQASFAPYFIAFEKVDSINNFDVFKVDQLFPLCNLQSCPPGLVLPTVVNQPGSTPAASPISCVEAGDLRS